MYGIIYSVENKVNGKFYIGQTTRNIKRRKFEHEINKDKSPIGYAIKKYGKNNFKWETIDEADNIDVLNMLERLHISRYESLIDEWGYNLNNGGKNGIPTQITRDKMSKGRLGEKNHFYGKYHSSETKKLMSESQLGVKKSLIHNKHNSDAHVGKYPGVTYVKERNPERKCWLSKINYNNYRTPLGNFEDPISASIVYNFVKGEIYREIEYDKNK